MRITPAILALAAALLLPFSAGAKLGYLAVEGMEADDYKLMSQAARERMDGKPVGHQVQWRNPKNGNSGVVTLKALEEQDSRCHWELLPETSCHGDRFNPLYER